MSGLGMRVARAAFAGAWAWVTLGGGCLLAAPAAAEETIRDWPCKTAYAEKFVPEEIWGGRLPGPLPAGWSTDAGVRDVVAFAANPENTPNQGGAEIQAFAGRRGGDRRAALLGVFAGLLEEFDTQREIVIEGVRDSIVRAQSSANRSRRTKLHSPRCPRMPVPRSSNSARAIRRRGSGMLAIWTMPSTEPGFSADATAIWRRSYAV